ncbi:MAG: hypothetical protein J6D26_07675 [Clostridia bacterium]|nr:hypothetical protein [Clostridia bacterium]
MKMHVISNTHWDREHRHSFQYTRLMLVKLMDDLIEIMEKDSEYKFFTLDGQSIMLHDYLEVRPHMRLRLEKLIKDGRILIGPWYSLVDCYSVNPESIIRNLLYGDKICHEFGKPMKVGYSIFSFGQIAQLPQIYNGFGIKDIMFYKGANDKAFPKSEFIWTAPDGSKAIATRLGKEKRWNFYFAFTIPVVLGGNAFKPGWASSFLNENRLVHMIDNTYKNLYADEMQTKRSINIDKIEAAVSELIDDTKSSVSDDVKVGFDGTDFIAPIKEIPAALKSANETQERMEFIHSNPVEYFKEFRENVMGKEMQEYTGEMRFGPVDSLHSETMGNNIEIKILDANVENQLIAYAETLSSLSFMLNGKYPKDELDTAWRYLFQAHAHDSIHGSGDPQIKLDNINRLQQIDEMSKYIIKNSVQTIAAHIDLSEYENDDILIMVFNPTIYSRNEVINLHLDIPREERVKDFWIEESDGSRVEMYSIEKKDVNMAMMNEAMRPKTVMCERADVDIFVKDIPAYGYKLLKLKRQKGSADDYPAPFPPGVFPYNPIGKSGNVLDNGFIRAEIKSDGTIDVYDYETNKRYTKLHYFEDTGCSGDFWVHREPESNRVISSIGMNTTISLVRNSSLCATYRVKIDMSIPKSLSQDKKSRSDENTINQIVYEVTLAKNDKKLTFKTMVINNASGHMLTLNIPTSIQFDEVLTDVAFETRKRKINDFTNNNGKMGPELSRFAVQNFVDAFDGNSGLTLMTKGLKEIGAYKEFDGILYKLTLLRSVSGTFPVHNDCFVSFDNENSDSIGKINYEYALYFHSEKANIIEETKKYITPMISAEIGNGSGGILPEVHSFINSNVTVAAIKLAENKKGLIIRLSNPTDISEFANVEFFKSIKTAFLCNMLEEKETDVSIDNNKISFELSAYKIATLYVEFN